MLAEMIEIGRKLDAERLVSAGIDVVEMQVGAQLINDAALRKRRRFDIPALMARVLFEAAAIVVHRPQIHGSIAVADEIDSTVPPHRILAGARIVGC